MKRIIILAMAACLVAVLSVAIASSADAGRRAPFAGVWGATDLGDGSSQTLWISEDGGHYDIVLYDHLATTCDPDSPATGFGVGRLWRNVLSVRMEAWCLSAEPTYLLSWSATWIYDPSTDTIADTGDGVIWHRR